MNPAPAPSAARAVLATLLPLAAALLQWLAWPLITPLAWFLFYPAVFFSSWLGGYRAGLASTLLSVAVVWWGFMAPVHVLVKAGPGHYLNAALFLAMGWLFSHFHRSLRRALRRAAEGELRERDDLLDRMSRLAQVGGWSFQVDTLKGTWTEEVVRIHDLPPGTPADVESGLGYYHEEDRPVIAEAVRRCMEESQPYDLELRLVSAAGALKWVRTMGVPLVRDGRVVQVHGALQDITARRLAEAETQRLNAALEGRVAERTAALQTANQELEAFAFAVSHDLRAPLRAMDGFSQALLEDFGEGLPREAKGYLDHIIAASQRMARLIDALLSLSRISRIEPDRSPVDLSALAGTLLGDLARSEPARSVRVEIEPGIRVQGDPRMLEAVMTNLLGNAWKYTSKVAEAAITVDTEPECEKRWVRIRDNGSGFDMAYADKLFQPFQRLHRQDEFPGLGIGLATVQRIVRSHGGELKALAAPGQGAMFSFWLPG